MPREEIVTVDISSPAFAEALRRGDPFYVRITGNRPEKVVEMLKEEGVLVVPAGDNLYRCVLPR